MPCSILIATIGIIIIHFICNSLYISTKCYKNTEKTKNQVKALLKRWVLRPHLKASTDCGVLRWSGRAFHRLGAAEQKARSPIVRSLVLGVSGDVLKQRRVRVEHCGERSSLRWGEGGVTMNTLVGEEGNLTLNPK